LWDASVRFLHFGTHPRFLETFDWKNLPIRLEDVSEADTSKGSTPEEVIMNSLKISGHNNGSWWSWMNLLVFQFDVVVEGVPAG